MRTYPKREHLQRGDRVLILGHKPHEGRHPVVLHAGHRATVLKKWGHPLHTVRIKIDGVTGTWSISRKHVRPLDVCERIAELA